METCRTATCEEIKEFDLVGYIIVGFIQIVVKHPISFNIDLFRNFLNLQSELIVITILFSTVCICSDQLNFINYNTENLVKEALTISICLPSIIEMLRETFFLYQNTRFGSFSSATCKGLCSLLQFLKPRHQSILNKRL